MPRRRSASASWPASGRAQGSGGSSRLPFRLDRGSRKTQDVEALARFDGRVYLIGSQFGRPGGPLESRRSFLARFREPRGAPDKAVRMEVVRDRFRLHRAINDALAASGLPLAQVKEKASRDFIRRTRTLGRRRHKAWADRILPGDLPLNIEGAAFDDRGGLVLGLRFPVTASGQPIIVELQEVKGAFRSPGWWPVVRAIRVLTGRDRLGPRSGSATSSCPVTTSTSSAASIPSSWTMHRRPRPGRSSTGSAVGLEGRRPRRCRRASSAASNPASRWKDLPATVREASPTSPSAYRTSIAPRRVEWPCFR